LSSVVGKKWWWTSIRRCLAMGLDMVLIEPAYNVRFDLCFLNINL
jgi:hypothetical protein